MHEDGAARVWNVGALLAVTGDLLATRFGALAVRGELSGVTRAGSGHVYFSLKDLDGGAALRCAMFRRAAALLDGPLREGLQVELRGRLAVFEARGELQMVVESLRRIGSGPLYEEFLRLRARLAAEGLFEAGRKRALPGFVRRVGVVSSLAGAALHDVVATLRRRAPQVEVIVYPSLVQGAEAPAALVKALALADRRDEVEVLILCRGGGSLEDLWAFNDERVVRAIAQMRLPVVSGIGHETDVTLADLAADLRAATPTAAAEHVAPERAACLAVLQAQADTLQRRLRQRLHSAAQRLDLLALRLLRPAQALANSRRHLQSLDQRRAAALRAQHVRHDRDLAVLGGRFARGGAHALERLRERVRRQGERLAALDPRRLLERGHVMLRSAADAPVTSATQLARGDAVTVLFGDGRADLRVERVEPAP